MAKGKDMVYCPKCGEEYNRLLGRGHKCSRRVLAELKRAKRDDEKVRKNQK